MIHLHHYSEHPFTFDPKRRYSFHERPNPMKPSGLWLSDDADFGWKEWCKDAEFRAEALVHRTLVTVDPARLIVLRSFEDIARFTERYERPIPGLNFVRALYLDWERIREAGSGLLITPYQWKARHEFMWYYGWDCASACIWDLSAVVKAEPLSA